MKLPVSIWSKNGPTVSMESAISGAVLPNNSLLPIRVLDLQTIDENLLRARGQGGDPATMVPQKFIVVSCKVAIPTPNITTTIACAIFHDTFLPKNAISSIHTAGICNSFAN